MQRWGQDRNRGNQSCPAVLQSMVPQSPTESTERQNDPSCARLLSLNTKEQLYERFTLKSNGKQGSHRRWIVTNTSQVLQQANETMRTKTVMASVGRQCCIPDRKTRHLLHYCTSWIQGWEDLNSNSSSLQLLIITDSGHHQLAKRPHKLGLFADNVPGRNERILYPSGLDYPWENAASVLPSTAHVRFVTTGKWPPFPRGKKRDPCPMKCTELIASHGSTQVFHSFSAPMMLCVHWPCKDWWLARNFCLQTI